MKLSDFSLLKEHDDHYIIGHPKGKSLQVPKSGLSHKAQDLISQLKRHQDFQEGTPEGTGQADDQFEELGKQESTPNQQMEQPTAVPTPPPPVLEPSVLPGVSAELEQSATPQANKEGPLGEQTPIAPEIKVSPPISPLPNKAAGIEEAERQLKASLQTEEKIGSEQKKAYSQAVQGIEALDSPTERFAMFNEKNAQLQKDILDKKIDPNRYFKNLSTGSKIASGIAMILGGIGSGLTGQPNMAANMIHNAIERDIDAQKNDQSKAMNLWKMNYEAYKDETAANLATQNQYLTIAEAKAKAAATAAPGAQAQARLAPIIMEFEQKKQMNNWLLAQMTGKSNGMNNTDPAQLVSTLVPEHHQKQVFKEIEAAQNTKRMGNAIMKSFDEAARENTVMRTGAGMLRTPASVLSLHQSMQPTFQDLEGTVRQAAMDNTFKNITPAPGDMQSTIDTKRKSLQDYLKSKASAPTAKGYGLDLNKFQSTNPNTAGYPPGSEITVKGKRFKVAADGDTLQPL